jgi:hypothetical protein
MYLTVHVHLFDYSSASDLFERNASTNLSRLVEFLKPIADPDLDRTKLF